jgi:Plasmid stabilization system protein
VTPHRLTFEPEALEDLDQIQWWIAAHGGQVTADRFTERLITFCQALELFPQRGTDRSDIRPGLRVVTFERSVTVAFRVTDARVAIVGMSYRGRDLDTFLSKR